MAINSLMLDGSLMWDLLDEMSYKIEPDEYYELVACGRGALVLFDGLEQTTADLDVFSLYSDVFPNVLYKAAAAVASGYDGLGEDWINNDVVRYADVETPHLTVGDFKQYFLTGAAEPAYFPDDDQLIPTLGIISVDPLGIVAAKMLAHRPKDDDALPEICAAHDIFSADDLDRRYRECYMTFTQHQYYDKLLANAKEILGT